jgi:aryl-alcohol dehydrogenase-like predicted oxidoreductase
LLHRHLSADSRLLVSPVGFGCEPLGGTDWGNVDIGAVRTAANEAIDLGVNLFDTAAVYGLGASETNLRRALGSRVRDVVISTKAGMKWTPHAAGERAQVVRDASPESIVQSVEASLGRLGIERIPLLFIHWPDPAIPLEDTLGAVMRLQEQGKVAELGLSNYAAEDIIRARKTMGITAVQVRYSLLTRDIEATLVPTCQALGIPLIAWGTLAQGLLAGTHSAGTIFPTNDRRRSASGDRLTRAAAISDRLRILARDRKSTAGQMAIGWILSRSSVASAIVGIKSSRQLHEAVAAASLQLFPRELQVLDELQPVS